MSVADKFSGVRVLCIGDVMLDRFISGHVKRISPESPVPVLSIAGTQTYPGGAANVARNVAALGGTCTLLGMIGEDAAAAELKRDLARIAGVVCSFAVVPGRPTTEKIRFVAHGQHMLRADTEVSHAADEATIAGLILRLNELAAQHDAIVLSDYAKGLLTDALIAAAVGAAQRFDLPLIVDPKSNDLSRYAGATVITPNSKEIFDATGIDPTDDDLQAAAAGQRVLAHARVAHVLITRAHRGMTLIDTDEAPAHIRSSAREVFDVVGAGDTVIATLALALGAKVELLEAARLANFAAGVSVGKRGPATVTQTELIDEVARVSGGTLHALRAKVLSRDETLELARTWRKNGFSVGFTNGCFDILHVGHLALLSFARQNCGKLVVAVNSDASVRRLAKGPNRPVNSEIDRAMVLAALSAVDAVAIFDEETPLEFIQALSPDVLVKGADYTVATIVGAHHVLAHGGKVLTCDLIAGKSTTQTLKDISATSSLRAAAPLDT